jgi:hypothetical protein
MAAGMEFRSSHFSPGPHLHLVHFLMPLSIEAVELLVPIEGQPCDALLDGEENGFVAHAFPPRHLEDPSRSASLMASRFAAPRANMRSAQRRTPYATCFSTVRSEMPSRSAIARCDRP